MLTTSSRQIAGFKNLVKVSVISGYDSEGTTTTVFPEAISGRTIVKNRAVDSEGQTTPTAPTASFIAIETFRIGGLCTDPSNLSAPPRIGKQPLHAPLHFFGSLFLAHGRRQPFRQFPGLRCDKFSAMYKAPAPGYARSPCSTLPALRAASTALRQRPCGSRARFAQQYALIAPNFDAVAGIRPNLLPADIKFHGAIDPGFATSA